MLLFGDAVGGVPCGVRRATLKELDPGEPKWGARSGEESVTGIGCDFSAPLQSSPNTQGGLGVLRYLRCTWGSLMCARLVE